MSGFLNAKHKCGVGSCKALIPRTHLLCNDHYGLIPGWLQRKLADSRAYGLAWKCHPTQQYVELRDAAIQLATREAARKYGKPQGEQLPLLTAT